MSEEEIISKIKLVEGNKEWFIKSTWSRNGEFDISVTDCYNVWRGKADQEFIQNELKPQNMNLDEYLRIVRGLLTGHSEFGELVCNFEQSNHILELSFKVKLDGGFVLKSSIKLKLVENDNSPPPLSITATPSTLEPILDSATRRLLQLEKINEELQTQLKESRLQSEQTTIKLNMLSDYKQRLETDMYKKFCVILNQKKAKIRLLQEENTELKQRPPLQQPPINENQQQLQSQIPSQQQHYHQEEEEEEEEEGKRRESEDEMNEVQQNKTTETTTTSSTTTSQTTSATFGNTMATPSLDLLGSMDLSFAHPTLVRRRYRNDTTKSQQSTNQTSPIVRNVDCNNLPPNKRKHSENNSIQIQKQKQKEHDNNNDEQKQQQQQQQQQVQLMQDIVPSAQTSQQQQMSSNSQKSAKQQQQQTTTSTKKAKTKDKKSQKDSEILGADALIDQIN